MLSVRIPAAMQKRLEGLAGQTRRFKSYFVRLAIREFLDEQADYLIAVSRLEDRRPSVPLRMLSGRVAHRKNVYR